MGQFPSVAYNLIRLPEMCAGALAGGQDGLRDDAASGLSGGPRTTSATASTSPAVAFHRGAQRPFCSSVITNWERGAVSSALPTVATRSVRIAFPEISRQFKMNMLHYENAAWLDDRPGHDPADRWKCCNFVRKALMNRDLGIDLGVSWI